MQPILPDERYHDPVRLLQEPTWCPLLRFHLMPNDISLNFSFLRELMLLVHHVGSLLSKCILSFVTEAEQDISFSFMHGRLVVTLCLFQFKDHWCSESSWRFQYCLTDCIWSNSLMFSDSMLEAGASSLDILRILRTVRLVSLTSMLLAPNIDVFARVSLSRHFRRG